MTLNDATLAQNAAADPDISTWLSANAGSGKTRVLTDRVARLLLRGASPQNILCLTYTKAAAGEMQNRLFRNLGSWAMLPDEKLREELQGLGEKAPEDLSRARTLFASAIETPGGLKIQTIHSFCAGLLRQFPLEAGVSPQFRELDEKGRLELIEQVLDQMAETSADALTGIARQYSGASLADLADEIVASAESFEPSAGSATIRTAFGLEDGVDEVSILSALSEDDLELAKSVAAILAVEGSKQDQAFAAKLSLLGESPQVSTLMILEDVLLLKKDGSPKIDKFPTKPMRDGPVAPYIARLNDLMERVAEAREARLALDAARKTRVLNDFAKALLPAYQDAKQAAGVLDFDDLIRLARALLTDRSLEWVLYRLDGRIDHILVDEAQDTSPGQWQVIKALAAEISAGEGARGGMPRSIFVVGDKKQSIYSFQGADARVFDTMSDHFLRQMGESGRIESKELLHSFRSSSAVLSGVDFTFRQNALLGVPADLQHRAFFGDLPGRIDLWPLEPTPEKAEQPPWYDPVDRVSPNAAPVALAERLARTIRDMLDSGTIPGDNGQFRRIRPGDFLILVQRRSDLFDHIIRACKALGLPMAGADRLKINGALAVRDLMALISFLALPEDDLSLAAALRSPLFGWSEAELFDLAANREKENGEQPYLWAELRNRQGDFARTHHMLSALRDQADFLRPYELLEVVLSRWKGRENLTARLGPEAEDGIDELLNQALAYEMAETTSLTGFLSRVQEEEIEIKRQSDAGGDLIRVMTVHGAKGLESEIVILPDTVRAPPQKVGAFVTSRAGLPVWSLANDVAPVLVREAKEDARKLEEEERQRLLYVAMTRAKSWLIVCGAQSERKQSAKTWHDVVREGLEAAGAEWTADVERSVLRLQHLNWREDVTEVARPAEPHTEELLDAREWGPPPPAQVSDEVSPSDLGGAKAIGGEGGEGDEDALRKGRMIHRLLEMLPVVARENWHETTINLLSSGPGRAEEEEADVFLSKASSILAAHPEVFAPETLAEVELTAFLPTLDRKMAGAIDRLIVSDDVITIVDFKSNAIVPTAPGQTPEGILRQMGAYLEAAEQIWPGRRIELKILWTETGELMVLEHGIVRQALARATTS